MTAPQDPKRPDTLVDLYREASAQDAGPSDASTAQILAHARAKAAQGPAAPGDLDSAGEQGQHFAGEAANDRRWWLQALGSLAAIGLVSWLALQHLNEPGAPQLEAPQMDSAPSAASAPPPPAAPAAADRAASPDSAKMRSEVAPMGKAASPAAKSAPPPAPASAAGAGASSANTGPAPAMKPAPQAERRMPPAAAPTPVAPPMPAPAAPAAAAVAPVYPAAAATKQAAERAAPPMAAAPAASEAASVLAAAPTLPPCGPNLDAQALAEQRRRIQAYDKALAAGLPAPAPVPLCRPAPAHEAEPAQPVDSR